MRDDPWLFVEVYNKESVPGMNAKRPKICWRDDCHDLQTLCSMGAQLNPSNPQLGRGIRRGAAGIAFSTGV
ncbi:MAG TPA: hypothetical protein VIH77_05895 [Steroidobacteraceae bacterium]